MLFWIEFIGVPLVSGIVGLAVWYFQSRINRLREEQTRLHDVRRGVYSAILDPYIRVLVAVKKGDEVEPIVQDILSYEYRKIGFEFTLMGSDDVVRAYNDLMQYFYKSSSDGLADPKEMLKHWGNFMLTLRRNLGNSNSKLDEIDMLRGWITDADKMFSEQ